MLRFVSSLVALVALAALSSGAHAQGILLPDDRMAPVPQLVHHRVDIEGTAAIATTSVAQTWKNPTGRPLEATYLFPVPRGATVIGFELEVDGKLQKGAMLDRDKAARIYRDIVARVRDPGLVEWVDKELFQVRIFPIPAHGTQRLKLKFLQPLEFVGGAMRLVYPLKTASAAAKTLEDFTLTATFSHPRPIRTVYSPTHKISVSHKGERRVVVGFEEERAYLDRDFVVYFGLSEDDVGLHVLAHRSAGEPGYFLLVAAPRSADAEAEIQGKNITFVLDTSGSMTGAKIEQAKAALRYCIEHLGHDDRFNVIRFSSDVERFSSSGLVAASDDAKARARRFVDGFEAAGGTAIDDALTSALDTQVSDAHLVLFITDGRPTVGETNVDKILGAARDHNSLAKSAERFPATNAPGRSARARVFVLGLGEDLNTHLLDRLAGEHGGTSHYVRPNEDVKGPIAALYEQVAHPVLTDVKLEIPSDVQAYAMQPSAIPDVFKGGQIIVAGRYRGDGDVVVKLSGKLGKATKNFEYKVLFPARESQNDAVASLWAHRQVGFLLDQIRLHGETGELKDEVVQLAKKYGIVTPYTSWLVVDDRDFERPIIPVRPPPIRFPRPHPHGPWDRDDNRGGGLAPSPETKERVMLEAAKSGASEGFRGDSGGRAVDAAQVVETLKNKSDGAPDVSIVRHVAGRVFTWRGEDGGWVDQGSLSASGTETITVTPFSAAWLQLGTVRDGVRQALALGERVTLRIGRFVVKVAPGGVELLDAGQLERLKSAAH